MKSGKKRNFVEQKILVNAIQVPYFKTKIEIGSYLQQGDVILTRCEKLSGARKPHSLTLALGEATGHHHTVVGEATAYIIDDIVYLDVDGDATLTHQEHGNIKLDTGTYRMSKVYEYDHMLEESREVVD